MATDEITLLIQSLQDQIKQQQEVEAELRHELDIQSKQQKATQSDNEYLRQKLSAIQFDNTNYSNTQARLETQLYAQEQDINDLRKEIQQLTKAKKDVEKKLSMESSDYENDKSMWQQREADLYNQIRSLSINTGEPRTPRTPRRRSVTSTTFMSPFTSGLTDINENSTIPEETSHHPIEERPTPKLAVIDSSYAREAKIAQRTIKAQDKLIFDLRNELEKQKSLTQEQQSEAQLQSLKIVHLNHEIANVKQLNRSLQEDNESYQILLHEKTITGEFMMNPIMQVEDSPVMKESVSTSSGGLNLAAELASSIPSWNNKENESIQKLTEENKMLQDTNRALQLYMNKILMKIINNKQLEDVLSIDQPTPNNNMVHSNTDAVATNSTTSPQPTETAATTTSSSNHTNLNTTTNRQRRRTISYWGKVPQATPESKEEDRRRHSSIPAPQPERSVSTTTSNKHNSSGWAKALRRMSGIGWPATSTVKEDNSSINNDSAFSEESSGSSTPSLRRSNELGTLNEE